MLNKEQVAEVAADLWHAEQTGEWTMSLSINGQIVETGSSTAVLANPVNAVAWLANTLHQFGMSIQEGDAILSGSFVRAIPFTLTP